MTPSDRAPRAAFNDTARLIHITGDPTLFATFTAAFQPMDRATLDAAANDRMDPWAVIADAFNDYEQFLYLNATLQYGADGGEPRSKPGVETAFGICRAWNPTDSSRPPRTADWLRIKLNKLRQHFSICRNKIGRAHV